MIEQMTYSSETKSGLRKPTQHLIPNGAIALNTTCYLLENTETIILLHGGPGVPDPMQEVALKLHKKFQVITFEQRGTGLSGGSNCSFQIEDYITDINAIADYFRLDSFHLFGHSWGGLYTQIYAQAYPSRIKSLFLCSPGSGTNQLWKKTEAEVLQFNKRKATTREWLRMGWYSLLGMLGSDRAYQQLFKLVLQNYHKGYAQIPVDGEQLKTIRATPVNQTRKYILTYPPLIRCTNPDFPIAIAYGDQDIYGDSKQEVINRFPTAQFLEIEGSGHIPWAHQPEQFNQILDTFYSICQNPE